LERSAGGVDRVRRRTRAEALVESPSSGSGEADDVTIYTYERLSGERCVVLVTRPRCRDAVAA